MSEALPDHSTPSPLFLEFVLRQAQIKTNLCTCQKWEHGYTLVRRRVADYNYIFIKRGVVVWDIDGDGPVEIHPGEFIVVPPGVWHRGWSKTRRITLGSIHVDVTLPGGQDVFELLIPPRHRRVARSSRLSGYLDACFGEWTRGDDGQSQLTMPAYGRLVTLELLRYDAQRNTLRQRPVDPLVAATLEELTRRLDRETTLDELAAWSGFTPQHLNRTFRRVLGVTPLQYLLRLRLERAAAMLADGRLTVRAIGRAIGIDDPYYFSRVFRQHFGRSPSQFRDETGSDSPSSGSAGPFRSPGRAR